MKSTFFVVVGVIVVVAVVVFVSVVNIQIKFHGMLLIDYRLLSIIIVVTSAPATWTIRTLGFKTKILISCTLVYAFMLMHKRTRNKRIN